MTVTHLRAAVMRPVASIILRGGVETVAKTGAGISENTRAEKGRENIKRTALSAGAL